MELNELISNHVNTVLASSESEIVVKDNIVEFDGEVNVLIDSLHLIKGVKYVVGSINQNQRFISFFDINDEEIHSLVYNGGMYLMFTDIAENQNVKLVTSNIVKYDISQVDKTNLENYPRISFDVESIMVEDQPKLKLSLYIKPDLFNEKILLSLNIFDDIKDLYVNLTNIINDIAIISTTILDLLTGTSKYIIMEDTIYEYRGIDVNGIRVLEIDPYSDGQSEELTILSYSRLSHNPFYAISDDEYHIIDDRVFRGKEDSGSIRSLRGVIEKGEEYKDCLLVKMYNMVDRIYQIESMETEDQKLKDQLLKPLLLSLSQIIEAIEINISCSKFEDSEVIWYYKGQLRILSPKTIQGAKALLEEKLRTIDVEVLVED